MTNAYVLRIALEQQAIDAGCCPGIGVEASRQR